MKLLIISDSMDRTNVKVPYSSTKRLETEMLNAFVGYKHIKHNCKYFITKDAEVPEIEDKENIYVKSTARDFKSITKTNGKVRKEFEELIKSHKPDVIVVFDEYFGSVLNELPGSKFLYVITKERQIDSALTKYNYETYIDIIATTSVIDKKLTDLGVLTKLIYIPFITYESEFEFKSKDEIKKLPDVLILDKYNKFNPHDLARYVKAMKSFGALNEINVYCIGTAITAEDMNELLKLTEGSEAKYAIFNNAAYAEIIYQVQNSRYGIVMGSDSSLNLYELVLSSNGLPTIRFVENEENLEALPDKDYLQETNTVRVISTEDATGQVDVELAKKLQDLYDLEFKCESDEMRIDRTIIKDRTAKYTEDAFIALTNLLVMKCDSDYREEYRNSPQEKLAEYVELNKKMRELKDERNKEL